MPRLPATAVLLLLTAVAPAVAAVPDDCRSTVDDPPPAGGPRDHRVAQATSSDGNHFAAVSAPELLAASVPDGVERADGETWVYFISGEAGRHGIHIGRVAASGAIEPFECVRLDGAFDGHAVDPDVVRLADGRYRLFYKSNFGLETPGEPAIQSAISDDGIHFAIEGVALETPGGADPSVVALADGSWLMATPGHGVVFLARGTDGVHFTPEQTIPIDGIPELWVTGEQVHLLAGANQLRQLVSDDHGVTWAQGPELGASFPGQGGVGSPSVSGHQGAWRLFVVRVAGGGGGGGGNHCQPNDTTLCVGGGRFRVSASWNDGRGHQGAGHTRPMGASSGTFWFFDPDNTELLLKVLDGCAVNDAFWVFAAGLTNLEVELRVEDLVGGATWTRRSQRGQVFPSVIDTRAFDACPSDGP